MFNVITELFFCQLNCSAQLLAKVCLNSSSRGTGLGIRKLGFESWLCHFLALRCWQFTYHVRPQVYLQNSFTDIVLKRELQYFLQRQWGSPSFSESTWAAWAAAVAGVQFPCPGHSLQRWLFIMVNNILDLILFFCVGFFYESAIVRLQTRTYSDFIFNLTRGPFVRQ